MAEVPAKLVGCQREKGKIAAGYDADLVVFDEDSKFLVTRERLHHRHSFSPYLGDKLQGEVKATYVRGRLVFADNKFCGSPEGRELPV
jgi:allantoinase